MPKGEASHSVRGYFVKEVGKAVIFDVRDMQVGNHKNIMLPTSQVHIKQLGGMSVDIYMRGWLYKEKFR
ncbi:hypothetical protein CC53_gp158 [Rhizobium phage vB_RleS_L338C]|uniref:hypothetical protein n=1 Tax=Rhizobium phage vB_RleS_L338C TaxID=1414737 RepID=UPI0003D7E63A|nr:hypothetical protein CC53_gp158 [Rhizobium phage vB_RleS_L338C]AHC30575.1 hypothetical protein L338C_158 [Rhizobium phage vB_RleS_L338C]